MSDVNYGTVRYWEYQVLFALMFLKTTREINYLDLSNILHDCTCIIIMSLVSSNSNMEGN